MSDALFTRIAVSEARSTGGGFNPSMPGGPSTRNQTRAADGGTDNFGEGYAAGKRDAAIAFAEERNALIALIAAAEALTSEPSEELAVLIGETVERLVTQIVSEADIRREWLMDRAARAASLIGEADQARTMWLHPADLALLDGAVLPLQAMADPQAERGSIRIDCSAGWIESGRALHLDALRTELGISGDAQ